MPKDKFANRERRTTNKEDAARDRVVWLKREAAVRRGIQDRPGGFRPSRFLVHIHIPKCGGTSVQELLVKNGHMQPIHQFCGNDQSRNQDPNTERYLANLYENERATCAGFENRMPDVISSFHAEGNDIPVTTFCVFRDPIDRARSLTTFFKLTDGEVQSTFHNHEIQVWPEYLVWYAHNYVTRLLLRKKTPDVDMADVEAAFEIVKKMDHVYIMDDPNWRQKLCADLGLDGEVHTNRSERRELGKFDDYFAEAFKWDIILYGMIREHVLSSLDEHNVGLVELDPGHVADVPPEKPEAALVLPGPRVGEAAQVDRVQPSLDQDV